MTDTLEIVVKTISTEMIKPSSPTPPHLKQFRLSYLNQILPLVPIFPTCGLIFFTATPESQTLDISRLKTSLAEALTKFYPLAGKINNETVNCTDEGLPFVEAVANCTLLELVDSENKLDSMAKFLPPRKLLGMGEPPITELTHLAVQVTVFACGGVSIGWYDIHKLLDGISAATFFKYWAALAAQHPDRTLPQPDFDACVSCFPPTTKSLVVPVVNVYKEQVERSATVAKCFVFKNSVIGELKAKCISDKVRKPTSFQAIAGFIWEQALSVVSETEESNHNHDVRSVLHVTLDIRPRVNPPLPNGAIGNLAVIAVAKAENQAALPELVAEIDTAVSEMKEEMKGFQGEDGVEAVMANWGKVINTLVDCNDRAYRLISWSRLGFCDLDFGFGKPVKMVPTDGIMSPFHRNLIILNDFRGEDGDGIEAWLFLEEKQMNLLEAKPEFLAFASPTH